MKRTMVAISLCALLGVTAACGGSSKKDTTATASAEKPSEAADTSVSTTSTTVAPSTTSTTASPSTTAGPAGPADATDAAFVAQANALCQKFNDQSDAVAQPTSTTPEAVGAYLDSLLTLFHQQVGELKALTPPPALADRWNAILTTLDAEGAKIESAVTRLKAGDTSAMSDLSNSNADSINSQFDAIGMTTCGSASNN